MKPIVRKRNESWNVLVCTNCRYVLDEFHSECNFNEKYCPKCGVEIEKSDYQIKQDEEYIEQLEQIIEEQSQVIKNLKSIETPESIKNLSREQLEELCLSAMSSENKATHRANDLEDIIEEAIRLSQNLKEQIKLTLDDYDKEHSYQNAYQQIDDVKYHYEDIKNILDILSKYKGNDE